VVDVSLVWNLGMHTVIHMCELLDS